jgi:hypothetical protein
MRKKITIIFFIGTLTFLIQSGCKIKNKKVLKKEYYASGNLKSYGWYINDSIPVDSLYTLYDNGNLSSIDIFDSMGYYIRAIYYFKNGKINELINYKEDKAQGFYYIYNENGNLNKKLFYLSDLAIGDAFFYGKRNNVTFYNFYNFQGNNLNSIEYDSVGNIIADTRQVIFIDSLKPYNNSLDKENERSYDLLLVISKPPKCKSVIRIGYLSKNNNLMKSDSVTNKPYYFKQERLPDSLYSINILGSQYDSIKNKTIFQKSKMILKYQE